jgi:hypothetical protein
MVYFYPVHRNLVIFTNDWLRYLQNVQDFHPNQTPAPFVKLPRFTCLESQLLCLWWRIPIHPCLWSANNCPTLWLLPLSPFHTPQFKLHYLHRRHQQSRSSSSGTIRSSGKLRWVEVVSIDRYCSSVGRLILFYLKGHHLGFSKKCFASTSAQIIVNKWKSLWSTKNGV